VDSAGATGKDHRVRRAAEEVSMSESAIFGESGQLVSCAHLVKLATCHVKTMRYNETVMAQFSCDAVRQGCTLSELIKTALGKLFRLSKKRDQLPPLPTFRSGGTLVDIAGRDALYQAMEERCPLDIRVLVTQYNPELPGPFCTLWVRRIPKNLSGYRIAGACFRTPCKVLVYA